MFILIFPFVFPRSDSMYSWWFRL